MGAPRNDFAEPDPRPDAHPDAQRLDVAIVGAGISGLVAAFRLHGDRASTGPLSVRLFEAQDRLGGSIQTERAPAEQRGDCLCEAGPDLMVTSKPAAVELCRELGLGDELLPPRSRETFSVVHQGRLHPLPAGFRLIAATQRWPLLRSNLFSWPGKLRMLLEDRVKAQTGENRDPSDELAEDESVESFVSRRFGREVFERVAEPVLGGLNVADATRLSAARALGPFVELERRSGSVLRGLRSSSGSPHSGARSSPSQLTLERGLGSLVERLAAGIPAGWTLLESPATRLRPLPGGAWQIETARGTWQARNLVLACPSPCCSALLRAALPELAASLSGLRFASCVTVNLVYRRRDVTRLPAEIGFFVPRRAPYDILAATYSSEKFAGRAPEGYLVVRTFQGGALDPDAVDLDDETLAERAHGDLARLIGIHGKPVGRTVNRFRETMPQFDVGHLARVAELQREVAKHSGLHLAGSALAAYGLPDCVASGEAVARRLVGVAGLERREA